MKLLFPIFKHHPYLVFLDSAASAQKPQVVLDAVRDVYENKYANIHRGLYSLSLEATAAFDAARQKVAAFFGVQTEEIVFTKHGTEAANLFASSFGERFLKEGDEVVLTIAEHHANFLPWLRLRESKGIVLRFIEPDQNGVFSVDDFEKHISERTRLVTFPHVSNVTGQIFPVQKIVELAQKFKVRTFLDACQSAPHLSVNFSELGVDAAFFTGHKMGAPGGTGGLYCRKELLDEFPPFLLGGDMVESVSKEGFTTLPTPQKFEPGTPAIAEFIGLGAACDFLEEIGRIKIREHEKELTTYALEQFAEKLPNYEVIGPKDPEMRSGSVTFFHPHIHPHDIAQFLDTNQICIRSGFHCAEPIHQFLKKSHGSLRASFWIYNEKSDIDRLVEGLQEAEKLFV